jgi:tRNA-dihydrouridine synthase B
MIGRAAQGAPWLPGLIARSLAGEDAAPPDLRAQHAVMREHLSELHRFYGDFVGPRIARKHIGWYLDALPALSANKRLFNRLEDPAEQLLFLDSLFNHLDQQQDLAA